MRIDLTFRIDNNHISVEMDGMTRVYRPLTPVEMKVVEAAAKHERLEIQESEKGCAVLVAFYTLEILKIIKYGKDDELRDLTRQTEYKWQNEEPSI